MEARDEKLARAGHEPQVEHAISQWRSDRSHIPDRDFEFVPSSSRAQNVVRT